MNVTGLHRGLEEKFDLFCSATTFESILACFYELCDGVVSKPTKQSWNIFHELSVNLKSYWKAAALFSRLEKRVKMKQYHHQTLCRDVNALVIGCGPCGMRCAIELALLGARVIIIEKRHTFSRLPLILKFTLVNLSPITTSYFLSNLVLCGVIVDKQ
ncbi:unnamed protein product [Schistosoma margrebowiei]|uniref:Uncharacterized protein n=1 Tax=Schistosoma margrebowiei TaxID=48269 RepID=A0A183M4C9_9TREM|nr:unnamed protein product [Schistosoma margrebowiei]